MQKILVVDHTLNAESMASCSLDYPDAHFFGLNTTISIDENLDACKPDKILVNKHFVTTTLLNQIHNRMDRNIHIYEIDYLIPNIYVRSTPKLYDIPCIISLHENHLINHEKLIAINKKYPPIYSYRTNIYHMQMAGLFEHTKDLFNLCNKYGTVIDASGGYMTAFCKFYEWNYGVFKPSGTISIIEPKNINKTHIQTNKDIYEQSL